MSQSAKLPLRRRLKKRGIRLLGVLVPAIYLAYMRLVIATSRVDRSAVARLNQACAGGQMITLALLHQDIFALPMFFFGPQRLLTVASVGDAGDVIAYTLERFGFDVARGGSSSRASRQVPVITKITGAARKIAAEGDGVIVAITPDGSRGPAGAIKPGVAVVAARTGASIYCVKFFSNRAWYIRTWDRTMIPLPFSKLSVEISGPVCAAGEARRIGIEATRRRVEDCIHRLHRRAFEELGRSPIPTLQRLED
ncbi:MAG: lysophospholipid acyltransferase family protein [Candidatus Binatia bacterium]